MRASSSCVVLLVAGALACSRSPSNDARSEAPPAPNVPVGAASATTPPVGPSGPAAQSGDVGSAKAGPLHLPKIVLPNGSVPIHASLLGWSAEGEWFGFCGAFGEGMAQVRCSEGNVGGQVRSVDQASRRGQASAPLDASAVTWRYGGELWLTWEVQAPAYLDDGPPHRGATFMLSGGAVGEKASYVLDRVTIAPENPDVSLHVDAISPSASGAALGAVIHGFAGEWSDTYHLRIWSTDDLASRVFNGIGLAHHKAGRYRPAAAYFRRANQAFSSTKASYNLACALAKLGDAAAGEALKAAVASGGAEVVAKARKDHDFDGVRQEPWFTSLVDGR